MKKTLIILLILILSANCLALEIVRQKNVATVITFPLVDSVATTALKSSAAGLDSEIDQWSDSADNPDGFADCSNEATEIDSTGQYYLALTQGEMNEDYIIVQIKSTDALTQTILIRTMIGDPRLIATTDDGGTINVTGGAIDTTTTNTDMVTEPPTTTEIWQEDVSAFSNTAQAGGILAWLFNLSEGDSYIDITQTPWQAVTNKKGTPGTEYIRKDLFDVSGGNVTSVATVIGKQTEP